MLLLGAAATASAQSFSDFFTVKYGDKEITEGSTVDVTSFEDYADLGYYYESKIQVINKKSEPVACHGVFLYNNTPSKAEAEADQAKWGIPSMCYSGGVAMNGSADGSCLTAGAFDAGNGTVYIPAAGTNTFNWEPHLQGCASTTVSTYKFIMTPMVPSEDNPDELEEADSLTFYICYTPNKNAVGEIFVDENAPAVYYDMQGNRVADPAKGIFIKVQGGKAIKVVK